MSLEQGDRTARIVLEHGVMKRREALIRELHSPERGVCPVCVAPWGNGEPKPCPTIQILDSVPPVVTEA